MLDLDGAKQSITEQFNEGGDEAWLEGWICGYTDPDHKYDNNEEVKDKLFNHMRSLRGMMKTVKR